MLFLSFLPQTVRPRKLLAGRLILVWLLSPSNWSPPSVIILVLTCKGKKKKKPKRKKKHPVRAGSALLYPFNLTTEKNLLAAASLVGLCWQCWSTVGWLQEVLVMLLVMVPCAWLCLLPHPPSAGSLLGCWGLVSQFWGEVLAPWARGKTILALKGIIQYCWDS